MAGGRPCSLGCRPLPQVRSNHRPGSIRAPHRRDLRFSAPFSTVSSSTISCYWGDDHCHDPGCVPLTPCQPVQNSLARNGAFRDRWFGRKAEVDACGKKFDTSEHLIPPGGCWGWLLQSCASPVQICRIWHTFEFRVTTLARALARDVTIGPATMF